MPELTWKSELKPDIFGVLLVQPERMAGWDLLQYIEHLAENRQQTERYESRSGKAVLPVGRAGDDGLGPAVRVPARP